MANITSVTVVNDTSRQTEDGSREYTRTLQVQLDDVYSAAELLQDRGTNGLPERGDLLAADTQAQAVSIDISKEADTLKVFNYEVTYSTSREGQEEQDNPLNDFNDVDWSSMESEEAYFEDRDGIKVLNSIGQQFEELPQRFAADWEVVVTVNQSSYDISIADALVGRVNNSSFSISDGQTVWSIGPDSALLVEMAPGVVQERNGVWFYRVRHRFKLHPFGWNTSEKFLDYGTYELADGEWVPVQDESGNDITERFPLDGNGNRVAFDQEPAELEFTPYEEANFGALPLV